MRIEEAYRELVKHAKKSVSITTYYDDYGGLPRTTYTICLDMIVVVSGIAAPLEEVVQQAIDNLKAARVAHYARLREELATEEK